MPKGCCFSVLLLIAALSFTHCKSDDNGGGGGGGSNPPSAPDPITCESEAEDGGLSFAGGDGTEDSPFEVSSAEQLANIGQILYCNFRLTQNITLSGNWTPLGAKSPCGGGNDDAYFQGKLDGNDFMISGLTVNITGNYGGLFGCTGRHAEIRNVSLSGVDIMAGENSGGLAGRNRGSISNSYVTGAVSSGSASVVGGLAGINNGSISNSYAASAVSGGGSVGGLVGDNDIGASISNSYATGSVSGSTRIGIGGLAGTNNGGISNSYYAAGAVSSMGTRVGGLVGLHFGSISNSYAAGLASSSAGKRVGGLIGQNDDGSSISGINYFASGTEQDSSGSTPGTLDGVGHGSACAPAVCMQATGGNDAARAAWLADSLDETDDLGLNWDAELDADGNAVWGNLNMSGFPCLKNMPTGAPSC